MKILFFLLVIIGLSSVSYAQTQGPADVPANITKSFEKSHPEVSQAEWTQSGDDYKANYILDNKSMSVTYNNKGKLKETEKELSISQLPTPVLKYVNDNYPGEVVKKSFQRMGSNGKSSYAVKLTNIDLAFDSKGVIEK
jgi:hypothetical protein